MTADEQTPASPRVAQEDRLRDALDAAADGPVPDAWAAISARVAADEPVPAAPRSLVRWLAVAAAIVVVAGGAGLAVRDRPTPTARATTDTAWCAVLARRAHAGTPVVVFLPVDATEDDVADARSLIEEEPTVRHLVYVDRETSFAQAQRLFADQPTMLDVLRPEDVPTSFAFTVADDAAAERLRAAATELQFEVPTQGSLPPIDVFTMLSALVAGDPGPLLGTTIAADEDVVEAFRAAAPEGLEDEVDGAARLLADPLEGNTTEAAALLGPARDLCGRQPPPPPVTATTDAANTTLPLDTATTGADVTGWVVPVGLPPDWTIEAVDVGTKDVGDCGIDVPQSGVQWVDPNGASIRVSLERCVADVGQEPGSEMDTVDLGRGTTGTVIADDLVTWPGPDGGLMTARGRDTDLATLVDLARQVVAGRNGAGLGMAGTTPDGWTELDRWMVAPTWPRLDVWFATPEGNRVGYALAQGGSGQGRGYLLRTPEADGPGSLAVSSVRHGEAQWVVRSIAPGGDVDVSVSLEVDGIAGPEDLAEADLLAAALRAATTDAWRDFISGAPPGTDERLATVETPAELGPGG